MVEACTGWHEFLGRGDMKNLLYSFNSVEISYGDNLLNSAIQVQERINDIRKGLAEVGTLNDFERQEVEDRLGKLIEWNLSVQHELADQVQKFKEIKWSLHKMSKAS